MVWWWTYRHLTPSLPEQLSALNLSPEGRALFASVGDVTDGIPHNSSNRLPYEVLLLFGLERDLGRRKPDDFLIIDLSSTKLPPAAI
jgi:hypothetical protein